MVEVVKSATFDRWLRQLKDRTAAARVLIRIDPLIAGNAGDVKPIGHGISEVRIDFGPGYRIYYLREGDRLILLLRRGQGHPAAGHQDRPPDRRRMAQTPKRPTMNTTENFTSYDSADYLSGTDDVAAYLEAAIDEASNDPAVITQALGVIARSGNLSELARRTGMSREGLYKALSADGNPSLATLMKVAHGLGLRIHFDKTA